MELLKKIFKSPYSYIFLLTYYCVWLVWDGLRLPFSNKTGIISSLPRLGYNPSNNTLRFIIAVTFPPLACLLFWLYLNSKKTKSILKKKWIKNTASVALVVIPFFLAVSLGIIQGSTHLYTNEINGAYGGPYKYSLVDTFHEGETLGTATAYEESGNKPYRDSVFLHGVFQDPLRSVVGFKLFGKSIGASRAFSSVLYIFTFLLYYLLLLVIFKKNLLKSALGLVFLALLANPSMTLPYMNLFVIGEFLPFRDIATILFLIFSIIGFRAAKKASRKKLIISSLLIGFIAIAGFGNSIDRAFYILFLSFIWLFMIAFMTPARRFLRTIIPSFILGSLAGVIVLGFAVKWALIDFVKFLSTIASHKEYLDGIKFAQPNILVSINLLLVGGSILLVGSKFLKEFPNNSSKSTFTNIKITLTKLISEHYITLILFVTSIVFMRSAIGRASLDHFSYSIVWLYLFISVLIIGSIDKNRSITKTANFIGVIALLFVSLHYAILVKKTDIRNDTFPTNLTDQQLTRTDHWETAQFLKNNLKEDESFVTLTSEGTWYYLVDKPSPVKYPIVWFAFMPNERKILADSIQNNEKIKYIITNTNWTTNFDYVPNEDRFPEVYSVLYSYYEPSNGFGQQTLWKRK